MNDNNDNPATTHYDRGYRWLHWSIAFLMMLMLFALLGFARQMTTDEHLEMLVGHSSIGTLIGILVILRLTKRFVMRDPRPVSNIHGWQKIAAKLVHGGLYLCMVLLPVSGYLTARFHQLPVKVFGAFDISQAQQVDDQSTFEMFRQAHELLISAFIVLLLLHIAAALYHRFVIKDQVLASMKAAKS